MLSAAIILTPGVIKQYFPIFISPLKSPIFHEVNCIFASLAPIRVGKSSIKTFAPNTLIYLGLKKTPPLPRYKN